MLKELLTAACWLFLLFPAGQALAQTGTIVGTVTDSTTGEPLPGVNVIVEGLNIGSATDADGRYRITDVPVGEQTVIATFIGYQAKQIPLTVEEGRNELTIALAPQVLGLENVVVTALGIERREEAIGYAVQEVEGEELAVVPETNFMNALQGKIAGANINASNAMGGSTRIVLRGANSITGNNQPLIVVDGVPINNSNFILGDQGLGDGGYDYGNAAQILNPANIKSVSVLKGPSAAALYGSRAANGAIVITTKSGEGLTEGEIGVTVNVSTMFTDINGLPDYQNKYGGGAASYFTTLDGDTYVDEMIDAPGDGTHELVPDQRVVDYRTDQSWGPRLDGRPARQWYSWDRVNGLLGQNTPWAAHPNNVTDFYRTGTTFNTTVAFAQGGEDYNYRLSLAHVEEAGVLPNSSLGRSQVSLNGSVDLTDRLSVSAVGNYVATDVLGRASTGYENNNIMQAFNFYGQRQIDLGPDSYMRDYLRSDGSERGWNWESINGAITGDMIYSDNPYFYRYADYQTDNTQRTFGKVRMAYEVTDYLSLSAEASTDHYLTRRKQRRAVGSAQGFGDYDKELYELLETSGQFRVTFDKRLSNAFTLNALAATELRYNYLERDFASAAGGLVAARVYTIENSVARPEVAENIEKNKLYSIYGSAQVGYRGLLYLSVTGRNDWSSTLPTANNSFFYPSVSASFVFSELGVLRSSDILSYGKLRASWAQVGSDTRPYQLYPVYQVGTPFEGQPLQSVPFERNNPNLKPEITTGWEVGTDLAFFDNRLGLNATYYQESTRNQILDIAVARSSGYGRALVNAGEITNQGLELALWGTPVQTGDFQWDVEVNWARNVSEVVSLAEGLEVYVIGGESLPLGPSVVAKPGAPYGAFYGRNFLYDENGNRVLNENGIYEPTDSLAILGSYPPDWTAGVSTTLSYKGFSLSLTLNGQRGGSIYSFTNRMGLSSGMLRETVAGEVRQAGVIPEGVWFPEGIPENTTQYVGEEFQRRVDASEFFHGAFDLDAATIYDASFIKLREASLSYTLPQAWLTGTFIRRFTVSLIGRNLATLFKNTPNFDPSTALSASNVQGLEAGQVPPRRSYGVSLRLGL